MMPEIEITIGGRNFDVACQPGEEHFLLAAAALLDREASVLVESSSRIPEARLLLMAGLMLADRMAGLEDRVRVAEEKAGAQAAEIEALKNAPPPEPKRVEVPVVPESLTQGLAELAARAESLADQVEEKAGAA